MASSQAASVVTTSVASIMSAMTASQPQAQQAQLPASTSGAATSYPGFVPAGMAPAHAATAAAGAATPTSGQPQSLPAAAALQPSPSSNQIYYVSYINRDIMNQTFEFTTTSFYNHFWVFSRLHCLNTISRLPMA